MSSSIINYYQLENYTAISVKGPNSRELLQGQVSCDLDEKKDFYEGIFCDEKGYVITNSTIFNDENFQILVKSSVSVILQNELNKFGKFYGCEIDAKKVEVYGRQQNGRLEKFFGRKDTNLGSNDWDKACMLNFSFDVDDLISGKFRANEMGYDLNKYVSYEKGCYRGQEIIARLTYLGKKSKKAVIFKSDYQEIFNSEKRSIGKKIFEIKSNGEEYSQFFVENTSFYSNGLEITPVTSQWDLDQVK